MMTLIGSRLALVILFCVQATSSQALTPTPTLEQVGRRADPTVNANIPTFTFRTTDSYFLKNVSSLDSLTQCNRELTLC